MDYTCMHTYKLCVRASDGSLTILMCPFIRVRGFRFLPSSSPYMAMAMMMMMMMVFGYVQMLQIFLFIICHKSSPIRIWQRHFYHLVRWFRPKCSSTNKRICPNVLVSFHMIIMNQHRRPSKQCMAFKLERNDWKCNWKNQKMPRSLTRQPTHIHPHTEHNIQQTTTATTTSNSYKNVCIITFKKFDLDCNNEETKKKLSEKKPKKIQKKTIAKPDRILKSMNKMRHVLRFRFFAK